MILNDKQIIELAEQGMITPFENESVKKVDDRGGKYKGEREAVEVAKV